jgi:D-beta-D-heptose 7-phosphate kinase/D-beta-D-heptose 1-phosphate adenosyltransferase
MNSTPTNKTDKAPDMRHLIGLIESEWAKLHVLVVGDVMLDRYIWGDVDRISPEGPVPIVRAVHRTAQPGGAANVAMNIAALGAQVTVAGFAGNDDDQARLQECLDAAGVQSRLTLSSDHPTTSKLRILGGQQQIVRLDVESTHAYDDQLYAALRTGIMAAFGDAHAVVLSDYAKGVLSEDICQFVIGEARRRGTPVLVGPKQRDFFRYRGANMICPNMKELAAATGVQLREAESMLRKAAEMLAELHLDCMTVTMSEKGIAVVRKDSRAVFPAMARQVFDVSGAGDTVIATLALALASGLSAEDAAPLANIAAGIVVSKVGTVPVTRDELLAGLRPHVELLSSEKLLTLDKLKARVSKWRMAGERVVFTNGCFDLLHVGHITLMEAARQQGDRLIVAINSDASVSGLKGPTRPIVGERNRGRILSALAAVDAVIVFDAPTPLEIIVALRPDVIVKGGDYIEETVVGAKEVRSWGGVVKIVPVVEGFSTTDLVGRASQPAVAELAAKAP